MIYEVFTVRDAAVDLFLLPFYARTEAEAIRSVVSAATSPEHQFFKHAEDFSLYKLGSYSEQSGKFELLEEPRFVVKVVGLLHREVV